MERFKITGTPGTPVRLATLGYKAWFTYADPDTGEPEPIQRFGTVGSAAIVQRIGQDPGFDEGSTLVHPITQVGGTVEFRHAEPEPSFTKQLEDAGAIDVETAQILADRIVGEQNVSFAEAVKTLKNTKGFLFRSPEPEPTYLDRLPEAVREFLRKYVNTDGTCACGPEDLARTIFEHRDAIFAAGEPVDRMRTQCDIAPDDVASVFPDYEKTEIRVDHKPIASKDHRYLSVSLNSEKTIDFARRGVAIALASKGGA